MPIHRILSSASTIVLLLLAGCTTSSRDNHLEWTKTTSPGKPVLLGWYYQVAPDCTFLAPPSVQILSGPAHGATKIEQTKVYPSFKPGNVRYKCNSILGDGVTVYYTPSPGFIGEDQVEIRSSASDGEISEMTVRIDVK